MYHIPNESHLSTAAYNFKFHNIKRQRLHLFAHNWWSLGYCRYVLPFFSASVQYQKLIPRLELQLVLSRKVWGIRSNIKIPFILLRMVAILKCFHQVHVIFLFYCFLWKWNNFAEKCKLYSKKSRKSEKISWVSGTYSSISQELSLLEP